MKTIENLKPGDTCYHLGIENIIEKIQVSEIDDSLVMYSTGYSGLSHDGCKGTLYGGINSSYVYFNVEDAIEELWRRKNLIEKEIEKWTISGKD